MSAGSGWCTSTAPAAQSDAHVIGLFGADGRVGSDPAERERGGSRGERERFGGGVGGAEESRQTDHPASADAAAVYSVGDDADE